MPDTLVIAQFERRLVELGCPSRRLREKVRELGDHYLDLQEAGLAEGLSESEAVARASERLGDPVMLAENLIRGMRQASWWGRHPVIGFCLLPPFGLILIWMACFFSLLGTCRLEGWLFGRAYDLDGASIAALQGSPGTFYEFVQPLKMSLEALSLVLLTFGFCRLARRSARGWPWMLATCGACCAASMCFWTYIQPHNFSIGMGWYFPGWPFAIPLVGGIAVFIQQRIREKRFASIPRLPSRLRPVALVRPALLRRLCFTPTYWVVTILGALIILGVLVQLTVLRQEAAHRAELKNKIWPAERAATLALLKTRQSVANPGHETTIDLQPWLNETLADPMEKPGPAKGNTLASVPFGIHTFAGVPFDVAGRMQLAGQMKPGQQDNYPVGIRHIITGCKCDRLHLLHGASNVDVLNQKIARLVLHYQNGSSAEIGIVSGKDLLDWWGPIYNTDAGISRHTTSSGTELAWAGMNPLFHTNFSRRLYRSTFANPHPDWEIASIDYISTLTGAAPFLVGLTVESAIH